MLVLLILVDRKGADNLFVLDKLHALKYVGGRQAIVTVMPKKPAAINPV